MKVRLAAAALALAALGLHLGLTVPYRADASAAADEYRRVRDDKRKVAARLADNLRLEDAQRRAGHLSAEGDLTPARAARLSVVRSLEGSGVTRVRLGVAPVVRGPKSVSVRLTGEGSYDDIVKFSGTVARPGSGLLLQQVTLDTGDQRVGLSLEAVGLGRP